MVGRASWVPCVRIGVTGFQAGHVWGRDGFSPALIQQPPSGSGEAKRLPGAHCDLSRRWLAGCTGFGSVLSTDREHPEHTGTLAWGPALGGKCVGPWKVTAVGAVRGRAPLKSAWGACVSQTGEGWPGCWGPWTLLQGVSGSQRVGGVQA